MPLIETGDGTQLFYKDWGTGQWASSGVMER
jgi:hypothetical protein